MSRILIVDDDQALARSLEIQLGTLRHEVRTAHTAADGIGTFSEFDPPIVFLDEPFTGLDPYAAEMLRRTLEILREQRRTLVLVTHDLKQGLELSDRWLLLSRGENTR